MEYVFEKLDIPKSKITINPAFFRPTEIKDIYGSNEKATTKLNWKYDLDFFSVLDNLIAEEKMNYE